jgi:predicted DNA-binding protein
MTPAKIEGRRAMSATPLRSPDTSVVTVRLAPALRQRLEAVAEANDRTLSHEIRHLIRNRLQESAA